MVELGLAATAWSMAALDSTGFLGADDRQQIMARERELRSCFAASDPSSSGFISKFDFRKALYVDGGLSYESVSTVLEDTPQSAGRVAYNLWFEAILVDQYPLRAMLKSERREEEAFNANMQQAIATNSELLYQAFSQIDLDDTGHINLVDFQRCVMSVVGMSNNDADTLFQSVEDLNGRGFVNYAAWLRSVQTAANAESLPVDARSALTCSSLPAMAIDRFWIAQNPALLPVKMAMQPLSRQAVSRTVALREQLLIEPNKSRLHGRGSHSADLQMDSFRSQLRSAEQKKAKLKLHAHALALQRQKVQAELEGAVEGLLHSEEKRSAANHVDEMDMIAKQEQIVNTIHQIDQQTPLMEQAAALGYAGRGPGPNGEHHSDVLHRQQQMQELHNASMTRRATLA